MMEGGRGDGGGAVTKIQDYPPLFSPAAAPPILAGPLLGQILNHTQPVFVTYVPL